MMPSRGLHTIKRARVPRLIHSQCRNLSSTPRPHLRSVSHSIPSLSRTSQPWARSIPAAIPSIAAIRHASTAQSQPAPPGTPTPNDTSSFPNLDTITLDDLDVTKTGADISNIPEGIGYLKQIGIDYGIGPTSAIEWVFEHAHVVGGLPWWGAIAATAIVMRLAMFPLFLKSSDMAARQTALASVTKPMMDRMRQAQKEGKTAEMMMAYKQMNTIKKRAGISSIRMLTPMALQGVLAYCGFKLMSACALLPVPGFREGGFLWLTDLTMTDGYLILPALMAATIHLTIRLGGETGAASTSAMTGGMKTFMMYGMPAIIFMFTAWQPGAVAVWFAASGLIGITQGQLLQRPAVRRFFNLAPLYTPKPGESTGGLMELLQNAKDQAERSANPAQASNMAGSGKNTLYMNPTYQSPNINRQRSSGRTIDTTLATPKSTETSSEDMIQPGTSSTPKKSILSSATGSFQGFKDKFQRPTKVTPEQERAAFKKKAERYEEEAQKRGR